MTAIQRALGGAAAVVIATIAMSAAFAIAKSARLIPKLPPTIIVDDISPQFDDDSTTSVAAVTHVSYGAAAGAAFALLVPAAWRNPVTGGLFGVALWATGYEGWLPLLGILPPAHRDAKPRAISILVVHLVYGAALGRVSARGGRSH